MNSMNQNKQPLYISICTQKGGAGKSVFTTLVASYLHYVSGYNVAVIDCDYPQWSICKMHQREAEQTGRNTFYANKAEVFFSRLGKQTYPVVPAQPETGLVQAREFLYSEEQDYDIVLFDLPGTVNNESIVQTYFAMDYLFVPVTTSRINMESTLPFIVSVNETMIINQGNMKLKGLYPFWNRVTGQEKPELFNYYENAILGLGVTILQTKIPQSVRYDKEQSIGGSDYLFLSTLFPPDKPLLKGSNLDVLVEEIIKTVNL